MEKIMVELIQGMLAVLVVFVVLGICVLLYLQI